MVKRPRTLEEVGEEPGLTRERVRQIESRAVRRLRLLMSRCGLQEYLKQAVGHKKRADRQTKVNEREAENGCDH